METVPKEESLAAAPKEEMSLVDRWKENVRLQREKRAHEVSGRAPLASIPVVVNQQPIIKDPIERAKFYIQQSKLNAALNTGSFLLFISTIFFFFFFLWSRALFILIQSFVYPLRLSRFSQMFLTNLRVSCSQPHSN